VLANLFLHYALDAWMRREMRSVRFCRYADDGVIHCKSEEQARLVLRRLAKRLQECGLELHPDKTKIVYCKDVNRRSGHDTIQFTFLGYTFRPRKTVDRYGRMYENFLPAVSRDALKVMRQTVRRWHLQLKCDKQVSDLSNMFNPVLRGWLNYYGRFYSSALKPLWRSVNDYLVRWLMRKHKRLAKRVTRAARELGRLAAVNPRAFAHWEAGYRPAR
jgi:RNA-directed DNA polymerase